MQGYPQITSGFDPFDWFPEECHCSGLDEAPSGTWEYYRGALRDITGDSPFSQAPFCQRLRNFGLFIREKFWLENSLIQ
jgi:hypothetical protein